MRGDDRLTPQRPECCRTSYGTKLKSSAVTLAGKTPFSLIVPTTTLAAFLTVITVLLTATTAMVTLAPKFAAVIPSADDVQQILADESRSGSHRSR